MTSNPWFGPTAWYGRKPRAFPTIPDPNRAPFAAGSFAFETLEVPDPRSDVIAYGVPEGTIGNQEYTGSLGHDFKTVRHRHPVSSIRAMGLRRSVLVIDSKYILGIIEALVNVCRRIGNSTVYVSQ